MTVQPATKKETMNIAIATAAGTVVCFGAFAVLHMIFPNWAPFDYTVIIAGIIGCAVAVLNFFWMAITVQKITSMDPDKDNDRARSTMALSLRLRTMMQLLWVIAAIVAPFFNMVSGIIPLFIPSAFIKIRGSFNALKKSK